MDDEPGLIGELPCDLYRDGRGVSDAIAVVGAVSIGVLDQGGPLA